MNTYKKIVILLLLVITVAVVVIANQMHKVSDNIAKTTRDINKVVGEVDDAGDYIEGQVKKAPQYLAELMSMFGK